MAARAVITMSPEQYLAGLKQLESATNKSASKMENSFKEYGTSINKAGIAMRYVSAEMGAGAVAFGRAFQVLAGGKIAVAVAAITGAFVALKKAWDELTLSSDEYASKLAKTEEMEQRHHDSVRKQQSEEEALIERLTELSERENKTTEEQSEAARITEILAGRYEKLGLKVNDATGEFEDLETAMKRIDEQAKKDRISALENVLSAGKKRVNVEFGEALKPGFWGSLFGSNWNETQREDWLRSTSLTEKRALAQQRFDDSKTTEELNKWGALIDLIDKQIEAEKELKNLKKTGFETTKEEEAARKKASEDSRKAADERDAADKARVAELDEEARKQEEIDRKHGEALAEALEKEQQIARERKKAAEQRRVDAIASLKFSFMRLTGQTEKAAIQEAIYNETKAQGQPLDKATISDITKRTKAELALSHLQNAQVTSPELYAPRVNSLIARGGSAAPMKLPKVEEYQAKTLSAVDKMAKDTGVIREYLKDNGLI